jgi:endonuclease/exonuclease/phosphatase family metal-dependent hydrolase
VKTVLRRSDLDLWGLVEVVNESQFRSMVGSLTAYDGLLASDPIVEGGKQFYSAGEQKVALVYKKGIRVDRARVVLTADSQLFAGRPPLEVSLSFEIEGRKRTLVVLVAHFKAMADADSWDRRRRASEALQAFLTAEHAGRWVMVVGDWNDDLDQSTARNKPTPFANFVQAPASYRFPTQELTIAGLATTTHFTATIDHHLVTTSLWPRFVTGSAQVLRMDAYVARYSTTTSDHYPVLTRYDLN